MSAHWLRNAEDERAGELWWEVKVWGDDPSGARWESGGHLHYELGDLAMDVATRFIAGRKLDAKEITSVEIRLRNSRWERQR